MFFGMTRRTGHLGGESSWKGKWRNALETNFHLSESGISCVGVRSVDLRGNTSEGVMTKNITWSKRCLRNGIAYAS
jgi:hypothetical protein